MKIQITAPVRKQAAAHTALVPELSYITKTSTLSYLECIVFIEGSCVAC